jgi:hypothetical protein
MSDKDLIGTVLSDQETPTFETVRIKLKSGQDVKPGTLVKIPVTLRNVSIGRGHRRWEFSVAPGCRRSLSRPVQAG